MPQETARLTRSQLIAGMLATGTLAGCGGGSRQTLPSPAAATSAPSCVVASTAPAGINDIFSDPFFAAVDKQALVDIFDQSGHIDALHTGYVTQAGQQIQSGNVIRQIPSGGIVIQAPGTYTFANDIVWTPANVQSSAITIQCSNVTLDLAGFTLLVATGDKSRRLTGILASGPASQPAITNIVITNGAVSNVTEYGVLARNVCGLAISRMTITGVCLQNLTVRFLTPAGIEVSTSQDVAISDCSVTQMNVTTDSSAGIMVMESIQATVNRCSVNGITNNDGAVQGFSLIKCINVTTTSCTASALQSHFNGNILTSGHTVLGFCPILCLDLSYVDCTASGLIGCCDDCHGMSVFLDGQVTVTRFHADNVVDGVSPSNSGAKATGLEVYGVNVTATDCTVSNIKAINPQDKQSTGFSAWGLSIAFQRCTASTVTVQDDLHTGARGMGFGWAPDPRSYFCYVGALSTSYTDCTAEFCDVGFDTWYHVNSTWTRPVFATCIVGILAEPGATRTLSGDPCSECSPPITVTLTNIASGNTYPH